MTISALPFFRLIALAGIAITVSALALTIVGHEQHGVSAAASGTQSTVELRGLIYQAPEARTLDPRNRVDAEILRGIPAARRALPRREEWFGVFLTVFNPRRHSLPAARRFVLVDLDGHRFRPERRVGHDTYAYRPPLVAPGRRYPPDASAAARNLTAQGALLLFRIPRASIDFGPLVVRIADPAGRLPAAELPIT